MTDWTCPEDVPADTVRRLHEWLNAGNPADAATRAERAVADVIHAFWHEPTLAEELRSWAEDASYDEDRDNLLHAASRAEQIEQERDHFFREVENVRNWKEGLLNERDEARAEVERLTAERLDRNPETKARVADALNNLDQAETVAVERTSKESLPVDQPDPADVKPVEAWIVECRGEKRAAVKDRADNANGWPLTEENEDVTLITRLVPAPRVITNPDELDRLEEGAVIRDSRGETFERTEDGWGRISIPVKAIRVPVTVLWEPEA